MGLTHDTEDFLALAVAVALCVLPVRPLAGIQVKTEVPSPIPGARPVVVERIKIHGTALEGNLEGDDVDRDVLVFLPPSYATDKNRLYPVVYALHGYSIGAEQCRSKEICMCPRPLKVPSHKVPRT